MKKAFQPAKHLLHLLSNYNDLNDHGLHHLLCTCSNTIPTATWTEPSQYHKSVPYHHPHVPLTYMMVGLLTTRGGHRTLEGQPISVNSTDCWTAKLENALWNTKPVVVAGVFTEQLMGSLDAHLLRNERNTLVNVYFECARLQSHFWLLRILLLAALPPSLFKMEFFPFPGLTNSQDLLTSLFLALASLATTAPGGEIPAGLPSTPSPCRGRAPPGSVPSSLHSAPYPSQFPTWTFFMLWSSFPLFWPTLP